jgi:hypothetical protein
MKIIPILILSTIIFYNVFSAEVELNVDGNANFVAENDEEDHQDAGGYGNEEGDDYYEDEFEYYDDNEPDVEEDIYEDKDPFEDTPFEGEYADDNYDEATTNEDCESLNDIIVHNKFNSKVFLYFSPEKSFMVLSFNTFI